MPHYIIQLEEDDEFAVYSTIVDNLITDAMPAQAMRWWLQENDYWFWLERQPDMQYTYWHEAEGFTFAKLADGYYCLPMEFWRN